MKIFRSLDRRFVYLLVFLALSVPILMRWSVPPARMVSAEKLYQIIETSTFRAPDVALIGLDFGPNLVAENGTQAEVVIEHLMRKRVPMALFSLYVQSEPFLNSIPEKVAARLTREMPDQRWEYGKDWVNLGYRPGGFLLLQGIPKSDNLAEYFGTDVRGTPLSAIPVFQGVRTIENVKLVVDFTGLVGIFDLYVAFLQKGNYRPVLGHGCTSITIPDAYIYLDSGQLSGLLEGIAGAAWYSKLLSDNFPNRIPDNSRLINTGLGVAHLVVILLVILGNIAMVWSKRS